VQEWKALQTVSITADGILGECFICGIPMEPELNNEVSVLNMADQRSGTMVAIVRCFMMREGFVDQ
jgi:hypothetical protein